MAAAFNGNHIRILSLLKYLNVGFLFLKDQGHEVDCEPMKDLSYCSYRVTHTILAVMPTADRPYRTAVMMTGNRFWMFTLLPGLPESFVSHAAIWRNQAESA